MLFDVVDRFAVSQRWAGPLAERIQPLIHRAVDAPAVRNTLDGVWLGAPLHPALTDVPVGAWTAGWIHDVTGSYRVAFFLSIASYLGGCMAFWALRHPPRG